MRRIVALAISLAATIGIAHAQLSSPITSRANTWSAAQTYTGPLVCRGSGTLPGSCVANLEIYVDTDATPAGQQVYLCNAAGNGWNLIGDGGAGGSSHAMLSATHTDSTSGTVVRGDLIAGIGASPTWQRLAVGTSTQVLHGGTEPAWSAIVDADVPNTITVDLAAAATALAGNPTDCSANQFANTIAASGNLSCAAIADADVPDTITVTSNIANLAVEAIDNLNEIGDLCTATQVIQRNGANTAWECINTPGGGGTNFNIDGDNNSPQTITDTNEALFVGGAGIDTAAAATDQVTFTFDSTEVTGTTTWGSGAFVWEAGATDPTFTFASNSLVITNAATLTVPNDSWSDAEVSNTLTSSLFVGSGSSTTAVDLETSEVAGVLTVDKGGTGLASITDTRVLVATATNTIGSDAGLTYNDTTDILTAAGFSAAGSGAGTLELYETDQTSKTSVTAPTLTADRAVTFPDAAGEVSLLGQTIATAEIVDANVTEAKLASEDYGDFTCGASADDCVVDADSIALTTDTTGDYVSSATASQGLVMTGTQGASLGLMDCGADQILKNTSGGTVWTCANDETGAGGGDPVLIAGNAVGDASGVDLLAGVGIAAAFAGGASPDTGTFALAYTDTLAGNPTFAAEGCVFTTDGTGGGGFLCEGNTGSNSNEQLHLFAAADGADTTDFIATAAAAVTDAIGAATTNTLTNKTLDLGDATNVVTTSSKVWIPAASCQNATAALNWDTPTANAPAAACITGTNTQKGVADFNQTTDESVQTSYMLPADWTGNIDVAYKWLTSEITGSVTWCLQLMCTANAETDDSAFTTQNSSTCVSDAALGTTLQVNDATDTAVTAGTGTPGTCAAGELMHIRVSRDPNETAGLTDNVAADARLIGIELTLRRAQ